MSAFFVYILQNPAGRPYIGQTSDLESRVENHNSSKGQDQQKGYDRNQLAPRSDSNPGSAQRAPEGTR